MPSVTKTTDVSSTLGGLSEAADGCWPHPLCVNALTADPVIRLDLRVRLEFPIVLSARPYHPARRLGGFA